MILLLSRNSRRSSSTTFMLLACFIVTTYDYATSASHDNERLVNHAARPRLGCVRLPLVEEERVDACFIFHPQRREGAALPAQRHTGSGERSFRLGLGQEDGEDTQGDGAWLRDIA
jgi:hypothetical protein